MTSRLHLFAFLALFALIPFPGWGAEADSGDASRDSKIDRIANQVDELHETSVQSPLGKRAWGVEVNPLYLLFVDEGIGLSGGISNFSWNRKAEIAFPVMLVQQGEGGNGSFVLNVDAHYRHFLSGRQRGFYLSAMTRMQHAQYQELLFDSVEAESRTLNRAGLGFGIGYRIFSKSGFYWGTSLSVGRFLVGNSVPEGELPDVISLWMGDLILDFEFLKFGFAF